VHKTPKYVDLLSGRHILGLLNSQQQFTLNGHGCPGRRNGLGLVKISFVAPVNLRKFPKQIMANLPIGMFVSKVKNYVNFGPGQVIFRGLTS
jgi:hypothetical protein